MSGNVRLFYTMCEGGKCGTRRETAYWRRAQLLLYPLSARSSRINAGQAFTVIQNGVNCTFSLSPSSASFGPAGGTAGFTVSAGAGCFWKTTSNDNWIQLTVGGFGTGLER